MLLACSLQGFVLVLMVPWLAEHVITPKEVIKVFDWAFEVDAGQWSLTVVAMGNLSEVGMMPWYSFTNWTYQDYMCVRG
jgi:hypothetical protein